MTLQQLRYAVVTAEKKTISEAAASLYLAQPSLTKALKELEKVYCDKSVADRVAFASMVTKAARVRVALGE